MLRRVSSKTQNFLLGSQGRGISANFPRSFSSKPKERVAIIGSGNWGSVAARIIAQNVVKQKDIFDPQVNMWVFEEDVLVDGKKRKLTELINEKHENVKYLPGFQLGHNLQAVPDLSRTVEGATMLVFVTPHQFIDKVCKQLQGQILPNVKGISLIKGMEVQPDGFHLISTVINKQLNIDCSVLMGANIANEIAAEQFSEATIGYNNPQNGELWRRAFDAPYFNVRAVPDVVGAELCGTLKNIVALASGFVDGLGMRNNTKAAIIRIGLLEMMNLAKHCFSTVKTETFFESAGVADLITTCFGGRNRKVAEAFVRAGGQKTFEQLETELLGGQKLQGVLTSNEVQEVLKRNNLENKFPLFTTINRIVNGKIPPSDIVRYAQLP